MKKKTLGLFFLTCNIAVCLLLYMILQIHKFGKQIHNIDSNRYTHDLSGSSYQKPAVVYPRINQDFIYRTLQLEDSVNLYFNTIGDAICYTEGTTKISIEDKTCVCRNDYSGNDCGIPKAVADAPSYSTLKSKLRRRLKPRRVVMAFTFNHEFDQLEARLHEHYKHVDVFLVVESNYSSHGDPKPLRLLEKLKNGYLAKYIPKLLYIFLDTFSPSGRIDGWAAENHIKNSASILGLPRLNQTRPDDLFLFSDADELVSKEVVIFLKLYDGYPEPMSFSLRWSTYTFYWKNKVNTVVTSACSLNMLRRLLENKSNNIRAAARELSSSKNLNNVMRYRKLYGDVGIWVVGSTMHPAGWHCSWCFSPKDILVKLTSAINADFPRWGDYPEKRNLTYISNLVRTATWFDGKKLSNRPVVQVDKYFAPAFFLEQSEVFKDLIHHNMTNKNITSGIYKKNV
ncbi:unnamed protein product [Owenia fusiformis]|uniref:Uncharacterized protein n=1 Tax=Owenia fusiformis TaxID=6347 RepID=A0A8J1UXT8_OWEFU|nr:unnamed protein product [Owenia fusiformis]